MSSLSLAAIFGILLIPHHLHHLRANQPSSPADYNNYYNDVDDDDDKDDDDDGTVHTFNRPGSSFVEYRLDWIPKDSQNFRLDFRFRTLRTNALLLHHTYLESDQVIGCRAEVVVRIQTGTLAVYRIVKNHRTQVIRLGKELNDDSWHRVRVSVDQRIGRLNVSITGSPDRSVRLVLCSASGPPPSTRKTSEEEAEVRRRRRRRRREGVARGGGGRGAEGHEEEEDGGTDGRLRTNALNVSTDNDNEETFITAVISVGGFLAGRAGHSGQFAGCISGILVSDGQHDIPATVYVSRDVEKGCINKCRLSGSSSSSSSSRTANHSSLCHNAGKCINYYVNVGCDCYGTGYEGRRCDKRGMTSLTFLGSDWLTFNAHDFNSWPRKQTSRMTLQFKTSAPEGVLLYAPRQRYHHSSQMALSLFNASLHLSAIFADQEVYNELLTSVGNNLDDDRWHHVTVTVHNGQHVDVTLDNRIEKMTLDHETPYSRLTAPNLVYYGGVEETLSPIGLKSQKPFLGCLREVYVNHMNVIAGIRSGQDPGRDLLRPLHFGCHSLSTSALQFSRNGAFLKVEHGEEVKQSEFNVHFYFKTTQRDGALLHTDVTLRKDHYGYIQCALKEGRLHIDIVPIDKSVENESMQLGRDLNDSTWHAIRILLQNGKMEIEVDKLRLVTHLSGSVTIGESTFLGFGPNSHLVSGYTGCMKNIRIQGVSVDPLKVVRSPLAIGVSLGDCSSATPTTDDDDDSALPVAAAADESRRTRVRCRHVRTQSDTNCGPHSDNSISKSSRNCSRTSSSSSSSSSSSEDNIRDPCIRNETQSPDGVHSLLRTDLVFGPDSVQRYLDVGEGRLRESPRSLGAVGKRERKGRVESSNRMTTENPMDAQREEAISSFGRYLGVFVVVVSFVSLLAIVVLATVIRRNYRRHVLQHCHGNAGDVLAGECPTDDEHGLLQEEEDEETGGGEGLAPSMRNRSIRGVDGGALEQVDDLEDDLEEELEADVHCVSPQRLRLLDRGLADLSTPIDGHSEVVEGHFRSQTVQYSPSPAASFLISVATRSKDGRTKHSDVRNSEGALEIITEHSENGSTEADEEIVEDFEMMNTT